MASLERAFIEGLVLKTAVLGILAALGALWLADVHFAQSVLVGAAVSAINLRFVQWVSKKLIDDSKEGSVNPGVWGGLLVLKMTVLFGVIWLLVVELGFDAIGFIIGFSSFLPAIGWQAWALRDEESSQTPDDKA